MLTTVSSEVPLGRRRRFGMACGLVLMLALISGSVPLAVAAQPRRTGVVSWTNFSQFQRIVDPSGQRLQLLSPRVSPGIAWRELVASWNVELGAETNAFIEVEGRVRRGGRDTRFYSLGRWTAHGNGQDRGSVPGQKDADGEVKADTLTLAEMAGEFQIRISLPATPGPGLRVRRVAVACSGVEAPLEQRAPNREAWGKAIPVPERTQMVSPQGKTWCSPATTSMLLGFWAGQAGRPEWDEGVEKSARGVFDPRLPGTGNWTFNTAYAGGFAGVAAVAARFDDMRDLEDWVAAGFPVGASVSYVELKGTKKGPDGHLVVVTGFTEDGSVIVNDPGTTLNVRKTFPRSNFINAWRYSNNTVYLIYPEGARIPGTFPMLK